MRSGVRLGLLTLALICLLLGGCSSGQKAGLITPAHAASVVKSWWAANEKALQSTDPKV